MTTCALHPLTPLQKEIAEESWVEIKRMVFQIVHLFQSKYGGDFDDLVSEAHKLFLLAHARHDPTKGKLTTCVYHSIYRGLRDIHRREIKRLQGCKEIHISTIARKFKRKTDDKDAFEECLRPIQDTKNELYTLLSEVSTDCKNILHIIFYPPKDFYEEMNELDSPEEWEGCLFDYLQFTLNWSKERVKTAFKELKDKVGTHKSKEIQTQHFVTFWIRTQEKEDVVIEPIVDWSCIDALDKVNDLELKYGFQVFAYQFTTYQSTTNAQGKITKKSKVYQIV